MDPSSARNCMELAGADPRSRAIPCDPVRGRPPIPCNPVRSCAGQAPDPVQSRAIHAGQTPDPVQSRAVHAGQTPDPVQSRAIPCGAGPRSLAIPCEGVVLGTRGFWIAWEAQWLCGYFVQVRAVPCAPHRAGCVPCNSVQVRACPQGACRA